MERDSAEAVGHAAPSEFGERFDRISGQLRETFERVQNTLTLKNLSFSEAYVKGLARVTVEFGPHATGQADGTRLLAVWHYDREFVEAASRGLSPLVEDVEALDAHPSLSRNQDVVFVSNVEAVDRVKVIPSVLEGLYRIKDKALNGRTWHTSTNFMSLKGSFRALPILVEGEECVAVDLASVGFDEGAISVVEGRSEIMNGISYDGGRVGWNPAPKGSAFPSLRIGLGTKSFNVLCDVRPNNRFKMLDVMVGPFYF